MFLRFSCEKEFNNILRRFICGLRFKKLPPVAHAYRAPLCSLTCDLFTMDGRTVGVLGGGQLGRMMAEAGHRLGVKVAVLDPLGTASPAGQVADLAVEGSFRDADKIK